jgi:TolA-binding protein
MVYRRAEMFFANGEYALAAQEYKRVVDDDPQSYLADDALFKLAHVDRVHLGKPKDALDAYSRLVTNYGDSPYVDDSLLWSVSIWARDLRQPEKAAEAAGLIDQRFPDRAELRARAHLDVARAYLEAGKGDDAWREAELVTKNFGDQEEPAAAAMLVKAQVWEDSGQTASSNQATAILEQVTRDYPQTMAGEEARRKLGFKYYAQHQVDQQKQAQAMAKEAQWLTTVPAVRRHGDGRLTMMEAARSLLGFAGTNVDVATLAALSGEALVPMAGFDSKGAGTWKEDPVSRVFEACGYAPTVWMAKNRDEAWNAAKMVVIRSQPALVAYNAGTPWVIVTGWRPVEMMVGIMAPGDAKPRTVKLADFLSRWEPASQAVQAVHFPSGAFYVGAIGGRRDAKSADELSRMALENLQKAVAGSPGASSGAAREAARRLHEAADKETARDPLSRWARGPLATWGEDRKLAAEFLATRDPALAAGATTAGQTVGELRQAILSARPGPEGAEDWQAAAAIAEKLATDEEAFETSVRDHGKAPGGG